MRFSVECQNLGPLRAIAPGQYAIHDCSVGMGICSMGPVRMERLTLPILCGPGCERYEPDVRPKANFAYVTGTNRHGDRAMIETMIASARRAGVHEDFHVFAPFSIEESSSVVCHVGNYPWKRYMAKIDFLDSMAWTHYDYVVWLDTDNYFVRDPGDLTGLIRDEPWWVSMEGDLLADDVDPADWYGLFIKKLEKKPKPSDVMVPMIFEVFREIGATHFYNTNAGMFIVRTSALTEFCERMRRAFNRMNELGFATVTEEPPLAALGGSIREPWKNTFDQHRHIWVSDWEAYWLRAKRLPGGEYWPSKIWLTKRDVGLVNPAIVHLMAGKTLMKKSVEAVGTALKTILTECGIVAPSGCSCDEWIDRMDQWGLAGCIENRGQIRAHLDDAAAAASWLDWARVGLRGYRNSDDLLWAAIRKAA